MYNNSILTPVLYFWNLLGPEHKGGFVRYALRQALIAALNLMFNVLYITCASIATQLNLSVEGIFWFFIGLQTLMIIAQMFMEEMQRNLLRQEHSYQRLLVRRHWKVVLERLTKHASYEWLIEKLGQSSLEAHMQIVHGNLFKIFQIITFIGDLMYLTCITFITFYYSTWLAVLLIVTGYVSIEYTNKIKGTDEEKLKETEATKQAYTEFGQCTKNVVGTLLDVVLNQNPTTGAKSLVRYLDFYHRGLLFTISKKIYRDQVLTFEVSLYLFLLQSFITILCLFIYLPNVSTFVSIMLWNRNVFLSYRTAILTCSQKMADLQVFQMNFANLEKQHKVLELLIDNLSLLHHTNWKCVH
jgi:hypothetical protein